jgi:hypothetical protein
MAYLYGAAPYVICHVVDDLVCVTITASYVFGWNRGHRGVWVATEALSESSLLTMF